MISQRSAGSRPGSGPQLGTGRGTLRLRSRGPATVEELVSVPRVPPDPVTEQLLMLSPLQALEPSWGKHASASPFATRES